MKLKIRLEVWEKTVLMQVLEQSERGFEKYKAKDGFEISISRNTVLYLSGIGFCKDKNNTFDYVYFNTPAEAQAYKDKVLEALTEFVEHMNGEPEKECCRIVKHQGRSDHYILRLATGQVDMNYCPECGTKLSSGMTQDGNVYSWGY